MERTDAAVSLEVLICTIGAEGIARVVKARHPQIPGVHYTVSWQLPDGEMPVPPALADREDFTVCINGTRGLSRNRNIAMSVSTAPLILIGDDDVDYSAEGLNALIEAFRTRPRVDIICCRYRCNGGYAKVYGLGEFDVRHAPKGWYVTSFEIAYRSESVCGEIPFNENLGIGAPLFCAGEESVWLSECCRAGARAIGLPIEIGAHDAPTTCDRMGREPWYAMTHGLVMRRLHRRSWLLRLMVHALREEHAGRWNAMRYLRLCLKGASRYRQVFPH